MLYACASIHALYISKKLRIHSSRCFNDDDDPFFNGVKFHSKEKVTW